ncbi:hypothetical protein ACH5RR_014400 [Cinchona calisaya]|uniref:HIG1 domain-containing protein n=1 Tax=Cinchona calisaya TaxID=153742 RepID=A0ABD3A494_9GENT
MGCFAAKEFTAYWKSVSRAKGGKRPHKLTGEAALAATDSQTDIPLVICSFESRWEARIGSWNICSRTKSASEILSSHSDIDISLTTATEALVGAFITAGVLTAGLISFRQGNSQLGQKLMRARVVAQGATVALMVGTAYYYGDKL